MADKSRETDHYKNGAMHVVLKAIAGPDAGRRISLSQGQVAQIGRTEWADFSFPADRSMADVHFAVESDGRGCRVRDLAGAGTTLLNGASVIDAAIHTGDEIRAGRTVFAVEIDGEAAPAAKSADDADAAGGEASTDAPPPDSAAAICTRFDLEDEARALLTPALSPDEFARVLTESRLYRDAVRLYAHWLPKRSAVWWGCACLRNVAGSALSGADAEALAAAEAWALEPAEERRRRAESAAEALGFRTAASWLAAGAFWSGGSIAPAGLPEVPPADHLTGVAVSAALMLAVAPQRPADVAPTLLGFLRLGDEVRGGKTPWEAEGSA